MTRELFVLLTKRELKNEYDYVFSEYRKYLKLIETQDNIHNREQMYIAKGQMILLKKLLGIK